ncbi:MAG: HlyD family efflux transporter periplasmic adaptor subunit [Methylococcales bacterium]
MSRKLIIFIIVIPLLALLATLLRPRPSAVELGTVTKGALRVMVESEGRTRIRNIYTVSSPVAGRLLRTTLKPGDSVKAGENLLAQIEPPNADILDVRAVAEREAKVRSSAALLELAQAEVNRALASLDYARAELKRNEALTAQQFLAQQLLEKSQLDVRTKETELEVAKKNLKSRQSELEMNRASLLPGHTSNKAANSSGIVKVVAQLSGKILRVLQESEVSIKVGTPILEIGDATDLEVLLEMLSENAAKVRDGAETLLSGWGGKVLHGRIRRVEPYGFTKVSALGIEEQKVNVLVDFIDPVADWQTMEHGYRVDAKIVVWERSDALKVPMGALFRDKNEWAVFRVTPEKTLALRQIKIGQSNNEEAEVLEGLVQGDQVVLHPSDQVRSGMPVIEADGS